MYIDLEDLLFKDITPQEAEEMTAFVAFIVSGVIPDYIPHWAKEWCSRFSNHPASFSNAFVQKTLLSLVYHYKERSLPYALQ